jgi:hypothetical protein
MGISVGLGKAEIFPDHHLPNPVVIASYQGYHEIVKYFGMAEARIRYLESLLNEKGISYETRASENSIPELTAPTEELNSHGREDSNSPSESV